MHLELGCSDSNNGKFLSMSLHIRCPPFSRVKFYRSDGCSAVRDDPLKYLSFPRLCSLYRKCTECFIALRDR